jgi:hypothetical protein
MKLQKTYFYTLTAAITLGSLSMGFSPTAQAISTYDASSSFSLTLTDVAGGGTSWYAEAFGDSLVFLDDSGDATADASVSLVNPAVSLGIGDTITQTSSSFGSATNGIASTEALTDLGIDVANYAEQTLTFFFDWSLTLEAVATGDLLDANASAAVDFLDDLGAVDILEMMNVAGGQSDMLTLDGSFEFELASGEINTIAGYVDSTGQAASVVPVPAAVWLFGSGLIGLVGIARRKTS